MFCLNTKSYIILWIQLSRKLLPLIMMIPTSNPRTTKGQTRNLENSKTFSKIPGIYRHWYPKLHRNVSFPFILPFLCLLRLNFACKLLNISFHPWEPIHFGRGFVYPPPCFQQIQAPATVSNQPTFIHIPSTSPDMVMLFVLVEVRLGHRSQQSDIEKKIHRNPPPLEAKQGQQNPTFGSVGS